ncbi:MurR/RpiR family transcriptional regulator [Ligilactobacillus faecis]|uniref:MurR/RpiR family transcriptional regulator n=1 Tax=Ligilactobacillus faecis TaxID=762833 RepID=UPI0024694D9C|nr:MurR/RpiR family transcriptional regulator [Ligilactobacillus faecis]WGN88617.1 MurR/RpiR family transcriptional regulator [Ligilactobacillus faecis]
MTLEELITDHQKKLGDLDKVILRYVLNNKEVVSQISITDLAKATYTSKSTILRLVRKLGFAGFSEFKYFLKASVKKEKAPTEMFSELQLADIIQTIKGLEHVEWEALTDHLRNASTIYCYGTGFAQRKALDEFAKNLLQLGKRALTIPNKTELDMAMEMITKDDVVIIASLSGETENIKENLFMWTLKNVPVMSITRFGENTFANHSDFALHYKVTPFSVFKEKKVESLVALAVVVDYIFRKLTESMLEK